MDVFARMLSGNSRLTKEANEIKQAFKENMESLTKLVGDEVYALLDMVYDSSYAEQKIFLKTPSQARLKSNKELVLRLLIGLNSMGFPVTAQMLAFVQKHGIDAIQDCLLTLLQLLSPLLDSKKAPEFTTDDVVAAMDFEWHSTSRTGSPLLNVIVSVSPGRASAASGLTKSSPLIRRAFSERSSRSHELDAKSALDKSVVAAAQPALLTSSASASSRISEIIPDHFPEEDLKAKVETKDEFTAKSRESNAVSQRDVIPSNEGNCGL